MRTKYFAIVLAAATAVVCVPAGSAFAALGEFTYTLEDGSIDTLVDPPDGECVEFTLDNGIVEAVNDTDQVADLSGGCEPDVESESEEESDAESTEGTDSIAKLQPGETYRHAAGDPIPLAVTFITVRSKNSSTSEDGAAPSILQPRVASR